MNRSRIGLVVFLALLAGGAAQAQQGNCPAGYYQIGGGGTSGCAPVPNGGSGSGPAFYYGAFAIDSSNKLAAAWDYGSAAGAVNSAVSSCVQGGGDHCQAITGMYIRGVLGQAFINYAAISADASGEIWAGQAGNTAKEAEKRAMQACSAKSKTGGCRLLSGAIYGGSIYGSEGRKNQQAFSMDAAQLLALSRERSEKKYLSTVATESSMPKVAAAPK